ncbi:MAG: hypothetical protein ABW164_07560 [Sphingobium sp.]
MRSLPLLLVALSLSAPAARAQNETAPPATLPSLPGTPAPSGPQRQGPELDVFRDPPAGQTPAPQAPVIQVPPPVVTPPVTTPPPATRAAPSQSPATRETPASERSPRTRAEQPAETAPAEAPDVPAAAPTQPENATVAPEPALAPTTEPTPPPATETSGESSGTLWPWIVGGLLLLAAGLLLWRRGRRSTLALPAPDEPAEPVAPPTPALASPPIPRPAGQPAQAPTPPPVPAPAPTGDRPHLALALDVSGARLSLMGATVGYGLTLTNVGQAEARDILIRAIIANASAPMDDLLKPFFAGEAGLAVHSVPSLAPGQTVTLKSELRLDPEQIAPINAGQRALLIPLLAFDARYGWDAGEQDALGRTGRAFIVGQEQEPPTERLSPFRLDVGPRQFRRPAARATALTLDA